MSSHPAPLEQLQRSSISSAVENEITQYIRQTFVGNRSRFARPDDDARFAMQTTVSPTIAGDRARSTLDYSQVTDPFDYMLFFVVNGGRVRMETGTHGRVDLATGGVAVCPVGVPVEFDMHDINLTGLRLPIERLERVAEENFGIAGSRLRFEGLTPISPAMHRYWSAVVSLTNSALMDDPSPLAHPLVAEEMTRNVAVAALHTFANTTMALDRRHGAGQVSPAVLRRAVAHIEANAHLPMQLADIAAAAGTSGRALQYAFRRHFDTTPLGHLRSVRLEHAHRQLQAADPSGGETVAGIAAQWGFAKASRFTRFYRERYGTLPSDTLRDR